MRRRRGILARERLPADRPLLLDVPLLVEGQEGDDDQEQLHRHQDNGEKTEEVLGESGRVEPVLRAGEPRRPGDRREDREDDRERGGHGQEAPVPAEDEDREEDVQARVDERHRRDARALKALPAPEGDDDQQPAETMSTSATSAFIDFDEAFSLFGRQSSYPGRTSVDFHPAGKHMRCRGSARRLAGGSNCA